MKIGVHKVAMAAPNDVSELDRLIAAGTVDPAAIVALIGKTEGNGGANDFTRGYATLSHQLMLARHLGCTPEEVGRRVAFVWSGGCEGGALAPTRRCSPRVPGQARPRRRQAPRPRHRRHAGLRAGGDRHDGWWWRPWRRPCAKPGRRPASPTPPTSTTSR